MFGTSGVGTFASAPSPCDKPDAASSREGGLEVEVDASPKSKEDDEDETACTEDAFRRCLEKTCLVSLRWSLTLTPARTCACVQEARAGVLLPDADADMEDNGEDMRLGKGERIGSLTPSLFL